MSEISDVMAALEAAEKQYQDAMKSSGEAILSAIGKLGYERAVVLGWTPGFNDGDPCEHSQAVLLDQDDGSDYGHEDAFDSVVNPTDKGVKREVAKALDRLCGYFELLYGTNFQLTIEFSESGAAKISCEEYDCGY